MVPIKRETNFMRWYRIVTGSTLLSGFDSESLRPGPKSPGFPFMKPRMASPRKLCPLNGRLEAELGMEVQAEDVFLRRCAASDTGYESDVVLSFQIGGNRVSLSRRRWFGCCCIRTSARSDYSSLRNWIFTTMVPIKRETNFMRRYRIAIGSILLSGFDSEG